MKIKDFHPESFVKSYRTYGDGVSLGEVLGNKEPQLEVTNLTSLPGQETSIVGQHGLEEQFLPKFEDIEVITPEITETSGLLEEPRISVRRTTKFRNVTGLTGGTVKEIGIKNALMAIPAVLLQPEYDTKAEKKYRNTEMSVDLVKGAFEFEGGEIFKKAVGGGGLPLNESGTFMDLWIGDLIHGADEQEEGSMANKYHKFMKGIREPIFGKDEEVDTGYKPPPDAISGFNKITRDLFGNSRYDADIEKQKIQEQADAYGISFEEAFEMNPDSDTGVPLSEGALETALEFERTQNVGNDKESRLEVNFTRPLKSYEERDPDTGRIYIDDELYQEFLIEEAGNARWEESQEEIRQLEQGSVSQSQNTPVYSQSRRNITEVYSEEGN